MSLESDIELPLGLAQLTTIATDGGDVLPFRRGSRVFVHPEAVRDILVANDSNFSKPRALRWARWTLGNGLLTSDGELHRRQRPVISPTLHPKKLAGYADTMARHAGQTADGWRDVQTIDCHREMTVLTLRIVAESLFGQPLGPEVDAISNAMDYNVRAFARMTRRFKWVLAFLPTPFTIRYLLSRRKVLNVMRRFIADRRASGEEKDDLLGRLIAAKTPDGRPAMSQQQVIDECVTLFAAGHETTANALSFTLRLVAKHPAVQARLQTEVDSVLGDRNSLPTIDDVDRLPYTRMVLAESMRLFPPAWIQGREALADVQVNGQTVRRGETIFISQWLTHRDPRWWAVPDQFDPDRFNPDGPAPAGDGTPRPRWAYFPFGGGSRSCVGEAFAWTEAVLVISTLARRWTFEPVDGSPSLRLEPGITLRPGNPIHLVLRKRS